jgi:hypothetical protein
VKPERIALMPDWPARMGESMAADYLAVSLTMFRERVKKGTYPQPVCEGRRRLWAKRQLDLYVAAQFGIADADGDDPTWADFR